MNSASLGGMKSQLEGFSPSRGHPSRPFPTRSRGRAGAQPAGYSAAGGSLSAWAGLAQVQLPSLPLWHPAGLRRSPRTPQPSDHPVPLQGGPLTTGLGQDRALSTPTTSRQGQKGPSIQPSTSCNPGRHRGPGVDHPVQTLPSLNPHNPTRFG